MTERPEDVYYGLILIQGTPPRLMAPKMPFADKRFFVLPLEARLERLFGNFCVCSLIGAGGRVFSLKFLELAKASSRKPRFSVQCDCLLKMA